ncbi:oxidoreductase [uncultured Polaribacter sp.]|uniref:WD40/YVTN/BNR-like repeat-containing protein n=1 Tax=uncultured Polaribacter sp. TaxID=174711 RepID=UPI002636134D|nr:oxidoreductase [uncultured Polaribacter sp.]
MKRIITFIFVFLSFITCKRKNLPRKIDKVTIQKFQLDSVSIRAIHVVDKDKVIYAGSNGVLGFLNTKKSPKFSEIPIKFQDSIVPNFRSIASNGKAIFAMSIANPALLYKITNGKYTLVYKEENKKVFYDAIQFYDDNIHGIAVGDPTEDCPSIIVTNDGGTSWKKLSCKNLPKFEEGEAFFAASNTNIKIIDNTVWIASGGNKARILKSTDYGNTWQVFTTPIIQGNGPQGIYSIDFANINNGIAIGGDYSKPLENKANKAITNDGGKTWLLVANQQEPNYKSCVQYVPNTDGQEIFAVGKTGVSFSNDAGKTWKEVATDGYYTIQFVDKNTAWLAGNEKIGKMVLK